MAKPAKQRKPRRLSGSHPASVKASVAIAELLKVKAQIAILSKRRSLLIKIIIAEGAGTAHGYRTFISHSPARHYWATKKERDDLKLVAITESSA